MKTNTPVFFKKFLTSLQPNAKYLRSMGTIPEHSHLVPVCEILYHGEKWTVREIEIKTMDQAVKAFKEQMEELRPGLPKTTKKAMAAALGISPATLRARLSLIEEWELSQSRP